MTDFYQIEALIKELLQKKEDFSQQNSSVVEEGSRNKNEASIVQIDMNAIKNAILKALEESKKNNQIKENKSNLHSQALQNVNKKIKSYVDINIKANFNYDGVADFSFKKVNFLLKKNISFEEKVAKSIQENKVIFENEFGVKYGVFSFGKSAYLQSIAMGVVGVVKSSKDLFFLSRIHLSPLCYIVQCDLQNKGEIKLVHSSTKVLQFQNFNYQIEKIKVCENCLDKLEQNKIIKKKLFKLKNFIS